MTRLALIHALAHSVAPINEALARIRQRGRFVSIDAASEEAMADFSKGPNSDPERAAAGHEFGRLVERAIDGLPDIYRSVLILREVEGMTTEETAASTQQIAASAQELAASADALNRLVARFSIA